MTNINTIVVVMRVTANTGNTTPLWNNMMMMMIRMMIVMKSINHENWWW
jgi:hypothetical protein